MASSTTGLSVTFIRSVLFLSEHGFCGIRSDATLPLTIHFVNCVRCCMGCILVTGEGVFSSVTSIVTLAIAGLCGMSTALSVVHRFLNHSALDAGSLQRPVAHTTLNAGSLQRPVAHTTDYRAPRKNIFSPLSTRVRAEHGLKGEKRKAASIV